ncbi:ABC transporter permease [Candidimonas nitroreducens]|uniref:ABC transporter permease n=1 Tax=Candidimonas nitroreducens TaxID=683354 RepID=A0A225MRL5_9BURK|nr:ABC transporter permease [Candidimonas nitroreducens]OWT63855.1 ABC transporter permease [Candidimonas nitroreducens]
MNKNISAGWRDFHASAKVYYLWLALGWVEIRQRYSRSKIGPFWLTISMGILIAALGVVYGTLFKADLKSYLPLLAVGFVFWAFISTTISEGCNAFIAGSAYIRQMPLSRGIFVFQTIWRNIVILGHNFIIVIAVLAIFKINFLPGLAWFVLGFLLLVVNLFWMSALLAVVCARFRDLPQIITSALQVVFYITPILFKRDMLSKYPLLIDLNPFAHMIEIVRGPLLGEPVPAVSWLACTAMAVVGILICLAFHGRYRSRIPYWV